MTASSMVLAPFKVDISTDFDSRHLVATSGLTSKNTKALPSSASGAKARKLAILSSEGNMVRRMR